MFGFLHEFGGVRKSNEFVVVTYRCNLKIIEIKAEKETFCTVVVVNESFSLIPTFQ